MPRNERVVTVFVSSPDDLRPERRRLDDVIRKSKEIWELAFKLRVDLIKWETHGYPGFGADAQDVLNREMKHDPDIFIGLMWCKFGTPTGRAGSGTEEEFNQALNRFRQDSSSVRIMFYFKEAPISPKDIDAVQFGRVQKFKSSLGEKGGLYWTFNTVEDFEKDVNRHLTQQLEKINGQLQPETNQCSKDTEEYGSPEPEDERGFIDYLDLFDENVEELDQIARRIADETENLGQRMRTRSEEIEEAVEESKGQVSRGEGRALINKAAQDMGKFVNQMRIEVPKFDGVLRSSAESSLQIVQISIDNSPDDIEQLREYRKELKLFSNSLVETHSSITGFKESIQSLPRMTKGLNKAKRETASILQQFLDSMAAGERIITMTIRSLDSKIPPE